jgi:hypothetical protein
MRTCSVTSGSANEAAKSASGMSSAVVAVDGAVGNDVVCVIADAAAANGLSDTAVVGVDAGAGPDGFTNDDGGGGGRGSAGGGGGGGSGTDEGAALVVVDEYIAAAPVVAGDTDGWANGGVLPVAVDTGPGLNFFIMGASTGAPACLFPAVDARVA